jgi:hypothetical protein
MEQYHKNSGLENPKRRGFIRTALVGGAAAFGLHTLGLSEEDDENHTVTVDPEPVLVSETVEPASVVPEEKLPEPEIKTSDSTYFKYYYNYEKAILERDNEIVTKNRELLDTIRINFDISRIDNEIIRNDLSALIIGLAFAESRLDAEAKSNVGAMGVLQLMPDTIEELIEKGEDIEDIITQVKIAGRLLEQTYRHITTTCKVELAAICKNHFVGDDEAMAKFFITPLMVNAYNAGMGTLAKLIKTFAETFPEPDSLTDVFMEGEKPTDYDVFITMTQLALENGWVSWYKDDSTRYTPRIYAAYGVVREVLANQ